MRRFVFLACILAFAAAPALAGDGRVSTRSLDRMGLGGMKVVSDQDGLQARNVVRVRQQYRLRRHDGSEHQQPGFNR